MPRPKGAKKLPPGPLRDRPIHPCSRNDTQQILSSAEGAYMAQMRQITCCPINLAIALMAVLRRLQCPTTAQISAVNGLLEAGSKIPGFVQHSRGRDSLWRR